MADTEAGAPATIAFLTLAGGGHGGATIRDLALARALRRRGYRVLVYWMVGSNRPLLAPGLAARQLFTGARYLSRRPLLVLDALFRAFDRRSGERRHRADQRMPLVQARVLANMTASLTDPVRRDPALVRRLRRLLRRDGVTHLLAGMGIFAPLAEAAAAALRPAPRLHVTLQGDELLLPFLTDPAVRAAFIDRLARVASGSDVVAVSQPYARMLEELLGLPSGRLPVLHPGIEFGPRVGRPRALAAVAGFVPDFDPERPLVTYVGRLDTEKGVDLLLYALRLLWERGQRPQVVIAGHPSFGQHYEQACRRIAQLLDLPVRFIGPVERAMRDALFAASRCVVYPPIHTEGFGMVAVEALAQGAPMVVPRRGGLVEAIGEGAASGGLTFEPWNSEDLARQIERLLTDDALHARLSAAGPAQAGRFDVEAIADRLLDQLDLPARGEP